MFSIRNILFVVIMMVIAGAAGFFASQSMIKAKYIPQNPIFKGITATVEGKVTKIDGSTATIQDGQNRTAQFPVDSGVSISRRDPASTNLITVNGSQAIDLNQSGFITLQWKNGQFTVFHIVYP
jgi:hypothetical protein